jgi:hypothetical protein
VIDLFNTSAAAVGRLHARGRVVVGYVAAGSHEPFRPDADDFPPAALGAPLAGYPSESWLDTRDPTVRQIMQARLALASERGFDGVMLTSLSAYQADSGLPLTAADQLDYNLWLAGQAHAQGLVAGIIDDWAQAEQLAPAFDFAVHINCIATGRCGELDPYERRGKPVFDLETSGADASVCAQATQLGLPVTFKRRGFDAWLELCP